MSTLCQPTEKITTQISAPYDRKQVANQQQQLISNNSATYLNMLKTTFCWLAAMETTLTSIPTEKPKEMKKRKTSSVVTESPPEELVFSFKNKQYVANRIAQSGPGRSRPRVLLLVTEVVMVCLSAGVHGKITSKSWLMRISKVTPLGK